ncbi:MAG: DNA primase [candidate division KSB1 bacterium]|nr:DNA primase [candidate division KSB1 bacterium]
MRIPTHKIEEIRQAVDIVDVVSGYLSLRRKGKNYFGLCPFHQEKTPSFSVNPQLQIFHCFGCRAGGNVFHFLMRIEGLSFQEAVKAVAERAGIHLDLEQAEGEEQRALQLLYEANQLAADFYREQLFSPAGRLAREYLRSRGLDDQTITTFGLGYAPEAWDALLSRAARRGIPTSVLEQAGLVVRREGGGFYDRFRHRVIFPLFNLSGRVVGFGARRLVEDDSSPKYINSPETAIYKKGSTLYGLYQSRQAIRELDAAIIVEGYMDLISLYQRGIRNVVATLGTALTPEQARLIRRYTRNAILFYDSDSPGFKAALRGAEVMLAEEMEVKIATVTPGEDPDSYVRARGAEAVREEIAKAESLFAFRLRREMESADLRDPDARARIASRVLESISYIGNQLRRSAWVSWLADQLGMEERVLAAELARHLRARLRTEEMGRKTGSAPVTRAKSRRTEAERTLIRILLRSTVLRRYVREGMEQVPPRDPLVREVWELFRQLLAQAVPEEAIDVPTILSLVERPEVAEFLASIAEEPQELFESGQLAEDCFKAVCLEEIDERASRLQEQIRSDPVRAAELTRRFVALAQLRRQVERGEIDPRTVPASVRALEA